MKGEITLKILESIKGIMINTTDLFDAILSSGYGASYGRMQYELSKRQRERQNEEFIQEQRKRLKQRYYKMMYVLKQDGLIEKKQKDKKRFWILTEKGKNKLTLFRKRNKKRLPEILYPKEKADKVIVAIFDVPEVEKRKRNWLRAALDNLGLKMVQKSVWMGKVKIPQEFLDDLLKMKLVDFVEIFEITKTGSLKHIA